MAICIKLDSEYFLTSDSRQYMIATKVRGNFHYITFHTTLEDAIMSYFNMKVRGCDAKSVKELVEHHKMCLNSLYKVLSPLQIRVVTKNTTGEKE